VLARRCAFMHRGFPAFPALRLDGPDVQPGQLAVGYLAFTRMTAPGRLRSVAHRGRMAAFAAVLSIEAARRRTAEGRGRRPKARLQSFGLLESDRAPNR
jgi:hypothetical protein